MNEPDIRVSDDERNDVIELLAGHAAVGRLTLAEHEERAEAALAAKTRGELAHLTLDLPAPSQADSADPADSAGSAHAVASTTAERPRGRRKIRRWLFAIMGGSNRRGRFRLSGTVNAVAIMGGDNIDLREAEIDNEEVVINVFALMGGTDIFVPDSVDVEVGGFAIMGGNDERGSRRRPRTGAPEIRIRAYSLMGGIDVWRLPSEARDLPLREAKRAAKQLERSERRQLDSD